MAGSIKQEAFQFAKAQGSALLATCCDYAARVFVDKVLDLGYLPATAIGALTGGIVNCCVNYRFVFTNNDASKRDVAWKYPVIWSGSILLNIFGTWFCKTQLHLWAYLGMIVTSLFVAVFWNYMLQRNFVFKNKKNK